MQPTFADYADASEVCGLGNFTMSTSVVRITLMSCWGQDYCVSRLGSMRDMWLFVPNSTSLEMPRACGSQPPLTSEQSQMVDNHPLALQLERTSVESSQEQLQPSVQEVARCVKAITYICNLWIGMADATSKWHAMLQS
jgi:hypothetical protein